MKTTSAIENNIRSNSLNANVIEPGYCIGCGICATIKNSPFEIKKDAYGFLQASLVSDAGFTSEDAQICPFFNSTDNEDTLGLKLYSSANNHDTNLGYYRENFAGHVIEGSYRSDGGSGGMISWLVNQLFERDLIDGVLHVKETDSADNSGLLFKYAISRTPQEVMKGSKSRYYPVELSEVLTIVKNQPGRYAMVGLPCFIKGVRLLGKKEAYINDNIKYFIGLVCGHLKSSHFADMLAWQNGIHPSDLKKINFRHKAGGSRADNYSIRVESSSTQVTKPVAEIYGYDWGAGLFKYKACDYCDDVFAELADVTIGDAWIPQYVGDSGGSNVVVVRTSLFETIIKEGISAKKVQLDVLSTTDAIASQTAGLRHRREGLAYRLWLKDQNQEIRPIKRVQASRDHITQKQRNIFSSRIWLRKFCGGSFNAALEKRDFFAFEKEMSIELEKYYATYATPFGRFKSRVKKFLILNANKLKIALKKIINQENKGYS